MTSTQNIVPVSEIADKWRVYADIRMKLPSHRLVIRGSRIKDLAIFPFLFPDPNAYRVDLVGWDSIAANTNSEATTGHHAEPPYTSSHDDWRAFVETERSRTENPPWDPRGRLRWLTTAECNALDAQDK